MSILAITVMTFNTMPVSATEIAPPANDIAVPTDEFLEPNYDDSHEYFKFANTMQRMDGNGNFTFSFKDRMTSDYFYPTSSTIKVTISAKSSNTDGKSFSVYVCKAYDDSRVKGVNFTANETSQTGTFSNLDTSTLYYLEFTRPLFQNAKITGSGTVTPIKLPQ